MVHPEISNVALLVRFFLLVSPWLLALAGLIAFALDAALDGEGVAEGDAAGGEGRPDPRSEARPGR